MELLSHDDPAILDAIVANFVGAWSEIVAPLGVSSPLLDGRVPYFLTGLPIMMYNCLFDGELEALEEVAAVVEHFAERRLPMMWFLGPRAPIELSSWLPLHLEEARMKVPGMSLDLTGIQSGALEGASSRPEIEVIPADAHRRTYVELFLEGFNLDIRGERLDAFAALYFDYPSAHHFLGFWEGQPAAIATVIYHSGVAGVYDVVTDPAYRGRGLGRALMGRVLLQAIEDGHRTSILHSTEMGYPLYRSLGYVDRFVFRRFLLRPFDEEEPVPTPSP